MRIGRAETADGWRLVEERDGTLTGLDAPDDLAALLRDGVDVAALARTGSVEGRLGAPLRPGKIVAIGLNYLDHVRETGMDRPAAPLVFAKFPSSVIGDGDEIVVDRGVTERVDWEVELAVVLGAPLRGVVDPGTAMDAIFGYTVGNDVSARDVQFGDGQWTRGKSLDTFCPLGPVVVTPDEVPDPHALALRTTVNDEVMQDSSTAELLFGIPELLTYCARSFALEPGDVLLTGTPWGCGEFMDPKRSLAAGDVVTVSVEGLGSLTNLVVDR